MNLNYKTMKRLVFALLMLMTLSLNAQENDTIIKFMGIPVDGLRSEMISQLKKKGFRPVEETLLYDKDETISMLGSFDGHKCTLYVDSYKGNVWQIIVLYDKMTSEFDAKVLFNNYVELLDNKYDAVFDKELFKIDLAKDISGEYDSVYKAYYTVAKTGIVLLALSYPRPKEYYIAIYYCNTNNSPNGEDL